MNERPEFEPHEYFKADDKGFISRQTFINHVRSVYDHMRKLSKYIQHYDGTLDENLAAWDLSMEELTEKVHQDTEELKELYEELLEDGILDSNIQDRLNDLEKEYAPTLESLKTNDENLTAQLAQKVGSGRLATLNDLNSDVIAAIKGGEQTNFSLKSIPKKDSVTPSVSTFFENKKNLFDGQYRVGMITRTGVSGGYELHLRKNHSSYDGRVSIIEVEPNTTYTVKIHDEGRSNLLRIGLDGELKDFSEEDGVILDTHVFSNSAGDPEKEHTFTTNGSARYLYVYVSNKGEEPRLQVEEGGVATPYQDYGPYIPRKFVEELRPQEVTPEKTSFFLNTKNLFDGQYRVGMITRTGVSGGYELHLRKNYSSYDGRVSIIEVEPNTTYTVKIHDEDRSNLLRIGLDGELKDFSEEDGVILDTHVFSNSAGDPEKELTFTTSDTSRYAYIYVSNNGGSPRMQLEKGEIPTVYEEGRAHIPSKYLEKTDIQVHKDYNFYEPPNSLYRMPNIKEPLINREDMSVQEFNDMFNQLVDKYPGEATSEYIGDSTGGYPMYKYELTPRSYRVAAPESGATEPSEVFMDMPKIVITSGIHGQERAAVFSLYYMFKEILESQGDNEMIEFLKMNVRIIAIPLINGSGWTGKTYGNKNNKQLNRDFPPYGDISQAETGIVKGVLDEHSDMDLFIDLHNMYFRSGFIGYSFTYDEPLIRTTNLMYKALGRSWQKQHISFPSDIHHEWGYNTTPNEGTVALYTKSELGVPSVLLECIRRNNWIGDGEYGDSVIQMGVEILVNAIIDFLR